MSLNPQEQANALYYYRKHLQVDLASKLANFSAFTKLEDIQPDINKFLAVWRAEEEAHAAIKLVPAKS